MKYAIIAAGEGSRLAAEGVQQPKPLVELHGECLIDRLMRIFMDNDAEEIIVICNDMTPLVSSHLEHIAGEGLNGVRIPLKFVVKSTHSSMHSFFEISRYLGHSPFVLTTVDTIFSETDFADYIRTFRQAICDGWDGVMGVTDFVDDEKPLYVGVNEDKSISGFYDAPRHDSKYISGGIYGLTSPALETLTACIQNGESRMRNFQRGLVRDGRRLQAYCFSQVLDIDHASDLVKAEAFLNDFEQQQRR